MSVSPSQWAIVVNRPSGLCVCAGVVKVPSTVTSAAAMAALTLPRFMLMKYGFDLGLAAGSSGLSTASALS